MSEVKVNKISPRTNCGTVQLGDSGDTITIPAGATITNNGTQTGFGRTGTVDWDTTAKTASFTAVSGNGYFVNTTSAAVTMTLPATPSAGDIVAFKDYASTFATNNLTIARNGSNLDSTAGDATINTNNTSMSLVYVDATQGWKSVEQGTGFIGDSFIIASGGTETTCGDFKIHTFTGPGTFCVSGLASCAGNNEVSYIVVAGGGGAGTGSNADTQASGGGGGAGGFRESKSSVDTYTASPLEGATPITVTATSFPITVGAGGAGGIQCGPFTTGFEGTNGNPSVFSTITSSGGGRGGRGNGGADCGGSGGGAGAINSFSGSGNSPPVSPAQGTNGSNGASDAGGGGGGATVAASNATNQNGADGGAGATTSINGSPTAYAGGGGGAGETTKGCGGVGGGGDGYTNGSNGAGSGVPGTANTGGGGGGAHSNANPTPTSAGTGGSGIVIIRYKYQ
jgi:hypothetical protein